MRETVSRFSLRESWKVKMLKMANNDGKKDRKYAEGELQKLSISFDDLEKKLDKLLESYLEEIIDTESYRKKKDDLLQQKKGLQEKIGEIKAKGSSCSNH